MNLFKDVIPDESFQRTWRCSMSRGWNLVAIWMFSAPPPFLSGRLTLELFSLEPTSLRWRMASSLLSLWRREPLTDSSMWQDLMRGFFFFLTEMRIFVQLFPHQVCDRRLSCGPEFPGLPCGWSDPRRWTACHCQPCWKLVIPLHQWCCVWIWGKGNNMYEKFKSIQSIWISYEKNIFTQVQFSLALPRIMFYAKNTTWRSSWLEKMQENLDKVWHPLMPVRIDNVLLNGACSCYLQKILTLTRKSSKKNINPKC